MSAQAGPYDLKTHSLRLREDCSAEVMPLDDEFWPSLMSGKLGNFHNEYLILQMEFYEDWPTWEIHPNGDEIVYLISGEVEFHLEAPDGETSSLQVSEPGHYVVVPQGYWHTAKVKEFAKMLFITPGEGTENRPL